MYESKSVTECSLRYWLWHILLFMPQPHHTPGPRTGCSRTLPGCFEQKSYVHSRGPHGPLASPYEFCLPVWGPWSFNACIISLRAPYGFKYHKQPVNSPCETRAGPVRPNATPVRYFCQFWLCQFPYVPEGRRTAPFASHARAPYGSRRI